MSKTGARRSAGMPAFAGMTGNLRRHDEPRGKRRDGTFGGGISRGAKKAVRKKLAACFSYSIPALRRQAASMSSMTASMPHFGHQSHSSRAQLSSIILGQLSAMAAFTGSTL